MNDAAATVEQLQAVVLQLRIQRDADRAEIERHDRALTEAREQQAAMTEVLRAIVASGGDASTVLAAIAEQATRIGRASDTLIYRLDGDIVSLVAHHGPLAMPPESRAATFPASQRRVVTAAIRARGPVHVADFQAVAADLFPDSWVLLADTDEAVIHRTWLGVPFLVGAEPIGGLMMRRNSVAPFADHEIAVVEAFAAEAALAIENARLFDELGRRNADLNAALEQQTATADILRIIASMPSDRARVLNAVVASARRLCGSDVASVSEVDGNDHTIIASTDPALAGLRTDARGTISQQTILEGRTVHIAGTPEEQRAAFPERPPAHSGFWGALAMTPLLRDGRAIGSLNIGRRDIRPFGERELALLEMFADQAVIAIENARLFEELERRNADLSEALEQQTATAGMLRVIASSPMELPLVLSAVAENASRVCGAEDAHVRVLEDGDLQLVAAYGAVPGQEIGGVIPAGPGSIGGRAVVERRTVHVPDLTGEAEQEFPEAAALAKLFGFRAILATPLLRDGVPIGAIILRRTAAHPFSDAQIRQLETFADQAVIAIENARLLGELHDRTAELADLNRTLEARVGEQVGELERVGRLRRYLSPQLADLIVSSGDESILESHRRQITVVFCDLRGFTAFAETAEPEEVMGVLAEYHAALGPLIHRFGGTLNHFLGDGLMVFFNDPLPQPDHAERAVRMACAMRERATELQRGRRRGGHSLGFGVGVAVGYATLGRIGFEGRYDYTAIGTVANLAARLCDEAADGQILVSARLHGMVDEVAVAEPLGNLSLKGFHRGVEAVNVVGIRDGERADVAGSE